MDNVKPNEIRKTVYKIRDFINTEEMKELKSSNKSLYETTIQKEFSQFYTDYPTLFRVILNGSDLSFLERMLGMITKIQNNDIDKFDGEKILGEELAEKYIYPAIKDQKPLSEKELKERQKMGFN